MTSPIVSATRCGECGMRAGSTQIYDFMIRGDRASSMISHRGAYLSLSDSDSAALASLHDHSRSIPLALIEELDVLAQV